MTFGQQVDEGMAHTLLDQAIARGINFIDTAEMYAVPARRETYGATERIIGVTNAQQLAENLDAWSVQLLPELLAEIDAIRWVHRDSAQ